ncbi:serine/threonine protein kinase [Solimonas terrae]|uniref:Serine/threonine protein kinase n=1 Tax=Solimonas terrae TaxID=1396819 RepID=A0A6M2BRQ2_9GAMM|nr:serine/threonine protein kinase [Solimonas terrae]
MTGWRAAFAAFERLLGLESTEREQAIEKLRAQDPGLWVQVHTLLRADEQAERAAFLDQHQGNSERQQIQIGSTLGAYRIERRLGEGGMGEVWLARRADGLFETPVALKLLHLHLGQSSARERFLREGRILGELAHRHVARLLDAGILPGGQLYLAIEYVEGDRIDRWCDARQLDLPARITLFLQVCAAVSHAHAHLVVHRDIKPSNILVTPDGEAKLLDFGIAKLVEHETGSGAETELTRLGGRAMTPEYAAPEQMSGAAITVVTDVYSLGVLLYWLLSGRRPYGDAGQTYSQIERQILDAEVPPMSHWRISERSRILPEASAIARTRGSLPRKLREALKGDLDTIVGKALQKAPGRRYASVDALADDLRRHLDNQPVLARPDTFSYRVRKFGRRHRLTVAATALVTITLLGGLAGTFWQAHRARGGGARRRPGRVGASASGRSSGGNAKSTQDETVLRLDLSERRSDAAQGPRPPYRRRRPGRRRQSRRHRARRRSEIAGRSAQRSRRDQGQFRSSHGSTGHVPPRAAAAGKNAGSRRPGSRQHACQPRRHRPVPE